MHVAGCMVFEGTAPAYEELVEEIVSRLHLVPRYRQRLAFVPLDQGRPVWVDDPHFNVTYHVRHTALPRPGGDEELKRLCGRVFSQALDRARPLWELWLVEGLADDRFALLSKTHHALVDGVSGVDIATVLFDTSPDPMPVAPPDQEWVAEAAAEQRAAAGGRAARARHRARRDRPRRPGDGARPAPGRPARPARRSWASARWRGPGCTPRRPARSTSGSARTAGSPGSAAIWPSSRRSRTRSAARSTTSCSRSSAARSGATCASTAIRPDVELKAMVPVSVRADVERGALGNRVAAMWAPLPVGHHRSGQAAAARSARRCRTSRSRARRSGRRC